MLFKKITIFALTVLAIAAQSESFAFVDDKDDKKKKKKEKELSIYDIDTLMEAVPKQRIVFYEKIDQLQKRIDGMDGKIDQQVEFVDDELYTQLLTQTFITEMDQLQVMVENMPFGPEVSAVMVNQSKIRYLRYLENFLNDYIKSPKADPAYFKRRIANLKELIIAKHEGRLNTYVREHVSIYTLDNMDVYNDDNEAKKFMWMTMGEKEPVLVVKRLPQFANEPYSGEVIAPAAKVAPNEVFAFANSSNFKFSNAVKRSSDPLVQTIVRIAEKSKKPLQAMPFLNDIHSNKLSIEEVDKIVTNPDLFFKNLVRLKVENQTLGSNTITQELQYRGLRYVRKINDLHDSPDPIRFKILEGLSPEELYFIMVYGQDEIYTSSFIGANKRMLAQLSPTFTGEDLLKKVHFDKFRTFIRMSAGYNTLNAFLNTMDKNVQTQLMQDFVYGLEKGKDDELEDAVDVADAFGSISDKELSQFLKNKVREGYERSYKAESAKGLKVYALLTTLFEGMESSENNEAVQRQSEILNLPPINLVPYDKLTDDKGVVYMRVFFYGDEDGRVSYASFMNNFKDGKWKVTNGKYFTTITATEGKPVVVFANNPLPEPDDEVAVKELEKYLVDNDIHPTVVVHRGHSYHVPITLDHLHKQTRIMILGSCGGYHNLANVLDKAPEAHIVSSKQTGAMAVNDPLIRKLNSYFLQGQGVEWINMWKDLGGYFAGKGATENLFNDYVPPHKNLGAIFIKAYRRLSAQETI